MRLFAVLVNAGADPTIEDNRTHNPQYYVDHQNEIAQPSWSKKWSNMILAQSPSPRRKKSERMTAVAGKERTALTKANKEFAKSARRKQRGGNYRVTRNGYF